MDTSETVAYNYLAHLEFKKIDVEPEGPGTFPDFLVEDRIAVEVRRLNQNETPPQSGLKPRGLEEVAMPVWDNIRKLLPSFGPPTGRHSWFVYVNFRRPVPSRRDINAAVRRQLQRFRDRAEQRQTKIPLLPNFTLELFPAERCHSDYFVLGGATDQDSGGFVISELERNLKICIDEKTAILKASSIWAKYSEWWLVLIDRINFAEDEVIEVLPNVWDKIILISPEDHKRSFELPKPGA